MNLRLKRTPGIYLVGFMGSGKSTVGRMLAARIGWPFFDLDEEIEARERTAIADIFATCGETEFRRIEAAALERHVRAVESGRPAVMALGGGAFVARANRDLLLQNGVTIWLDCPFPSSNGVSAKPLTALLPATPSNLPLSTRPAGMSIA